MVAAFAARRPRAARPIAADRVAAALAVARNIALLDRGVGAKQRGAAVAAIDTPQIEHDPRIPREATVAEFAAKMKTLALLLTVLLDGANVRVTFGARP